MWGRSSPPMAVDDAFFNRVGHDLRGELASMTGDAELLEIALGYALDFAIARSRDQRVTVSARRDGDGASLCVSDLAGPISQERLAQLAQPFVEKEAIPRPDPGQRVR